MTIMIDEKFARLRTYRNNIDRHHRLLKTELSELERQFIEGRLNEQKSAIDSLANNSTEIHHLWRPCPTLIGGASHRAKRQ